MKIDWKNIGIKELAIIVSSELERNDISAVLVGGACVSIYSHNEYLSMDLDYVSYATTKVLRNVMSKLGFYQKKGRHFEHKECPFFVEFPPPPISIGNEVPIEKFNHIKSLELLTPTDCVKDRLAAYFHWNDLQSLDQALMVAKTQKVNLSEIRRWAKDEQAVEKFKRFESLIKSAGKSKAKIDR